MPTLLLRLAAPLQSWGCGSKFETRTTEKMPTKSGVIGMLAAALGMRRDADLSRLSVLRFGVRADRDGEDITDFHTAHAEKSSYVTYRHYLSDAVFLAGVEGDKELLKKLERALKAPRFPLFLGRRSCPPTLPLVLGITDETLEDALFHADILCDENGNPVSKEKSLRVHIESDGPDAGTVQDAPISFDIHRREFGYRKVREDFVFKTPQPPEQTEHDAMSELR